MNNITFSKTGLENPLVQKALFELNSKKLSFVSVCVSELDADEYQRDSKPSLVDEISNNLSIPLLKIIIVSLRDGKYNVIDGKHRVKGIQGIDPKAMVVVMLLEGLTKDEEIEYFEELNDKKNQNTISPYDVFKAVLCKSSLTTDARKHIFSLLYKIAEEEGFVLFKHPRANCDTICSIPTLLKVVKMKDNGGYEFYRKVLKLLKRTWSGCNGIGEARFIKAVAAFVLKYENHFDIDTFCETMKERRVLPSDLLGYAKGKNDTNTVIIGHLVAHYNKGKNNTGLRGKYKLEDHYGYKVHN